MISDRDINAVYFSQLIERKFASVYSEVYEKLDGFGLKAKLLPETKDIWARDFMPIQVNGDKFVEYRYDPDYLKKMGKRGSEIQTDPNVICDVIGLKTVKANIILDGGNVVKSSNAVILTDKVVWENRHTYSEQRLLNKLHDLFEVDKVVLIPWDEKCDYGHADGMLRFIDDDTVLISGFYKSEDDQFKEGILKSLSENGLRHEWLKCSAKEESEKNIAYINFLQTKDLILVPQLNRMEDEKAYEQICHYYPEYAERKRIAQINVRKVFKKGGALNCISWTTKE